MVKFSKLKKNSQEAKWFDYEQGVRLKIAPLGNKKYDQALTRIGSKKKRILRKKDASHPEVIKITQQAVCEAILLDWEGVEGDDNQPLPYDPKIAMEIMVENYDFYKEVLEMATELKNGIAQDEEDAEGN